MAVEHLTIINGLIIAADSPKEVESTGSEIPLEITERLSSRWQNLKTLGRYTGAGVGIGLMLCGANAATFPYLQQEQHLLQWQAVSLGFSSFLGVTQGLIKILPEHWPTR